MKKNAILFLIVFYQMQFFAQTKYYQKLFDDSFPMEHSVDSVQVNIYNECTEEMEGLLLMYEATNDVKYLQVFVQYAKNVIDKRDDLRDVIPPEAPNSPSMSYYPVYGPAQTKIFNFLNFSSPTWSTNYYNASPNVGAPYPNQHDNYRILYPFIKFYNIIKTNEALQSINVNSSGTDAMYHYQYMLPVKSFDYVAQQFLNRVIETIDYYDSNELGLWLSDVGVYKEFNFTSDLYIGSARYPNHILPMNMQASIGRTLLQLYKATNNDIYLNKIRAIGVYIKSKTTINTITNSKSWHYWGGVDPDVVQGITKPLREDVPHSSLTAIFPLECYQSGITLTNEDNQLLFSATDILQYANTFTKDIYKDVLILKEGVTNQDTDPLWIFDFKKNINLVTNILPNKNLYLYEYWIAYSEIDANIYQMLSDFNTSIFYQSPNAGSSSYLKNHKTLAYLAKYDQKFVPIAAEHGWGINSRWAGISKGNFDGNLSDGDEFVFLRNYDHKIIIQNKNPNEASLETTILSLEPNLGVGLFLDNIDYDYKWAGVAAGDFYGDEKSEIIALSNCTTAGRNGFYTFNINNVSGNGSTINFEQTKSGLGFGVLSDWAGITAGNFINDTYNKDDFITVRNVDKGLYLYKSNGSDVQYVTSISLSNILLGAGNIGSNSIISAIASGNLDGNLSNGDELAVLVNGSSSDNTGLYIYQINELGDFIPLTLIAKSIGWGVGGEFEGLAVGDFDNNGKDEVVIHRNFDAHYRIYELNAANNGFLSKGADFFDIRQTRDNILCAGNFNPVSENDELISLRNTDSGIVMYSNSVYINAISASNKEVKLISDVIEERRNKQNFAIFPNPTNKRLNMFLKSTLNKCYFTIYDSYGINLKEGIVENNISDVDISNFKKGIYFVKFISDDIQDTIKVIIN